MSNLTRRTKYKILQHGIVWLIFFYLNIKYLQQWLPSIGISKTVLQLVFYSIAYLPLLFTAPYLNYFYLLPRFFFRKKYLIYLFILFMATLADSALCALLDFAFLFHDGQSWLLTQEHLWSRVPMIGLFILLSVWSRMTSEYEDQLELQKELEQKRTEAEFKWLKAQISPHFLFNALNNIHSLVHLKKDEASPMLVKLGDMMRYILYDTHAQSISLEREIEYIRNYIQLQSLKKRWSKKISFELDGDPGGIEVEPLLFINFVENAFKHCNLDEPNAFISLTVRIKAEKIIFSIMNTMQAGPVERTKGIGLKNTRQRLDLAYSGNYRLNLKEEEGVFKVLLEIPISKNRSKDEI